MNAQRKQQIMRLVCVAMLGLIFSHTADAHRLDEYLQASQISIESGRIIVEINLTPGAAVADGVIAEIDRDADGELSPSEARHTRALLCGRFRWKWMAVSGLSSSKGIDSRRLQQCGRGWERFGCMPWQNRRLSQGSIASSSGMRIDPISAPIWSMRWFPPMNGSQFMVSPEIFFNASTPWSMRLVYPALRLVPRRYPHW
jgi:hypothetical protein